MKRHYFLVGLCISLILISLSFAANAADPPAINWTPVDQLKPLPSGPGVVVVEPVTSDEKLANFGAGCARWLHLNVSSNVAFEKTAEWDALANVVAISGRKNLQLTPAQAKVLFATTLGATHVITGNIAENNGAISLKWQVWRLSDLKLIGEVSADAPSEDAVVAALPQTGQKLVALMSGDQKYYADNVIAPTLNADELSFIGSLSWNMGFETSQQVANRLAVLSRKSILANMFYLSYLWETGAPSFSYHTFGLWRDALGTLFLSVMKYPGSKIVKKNLLAVEECFHWLSNSPKSVQDAHRGYVNLFPDYPNNYLSRMQKCIAFNYASWKDIETAVQLNSGGACAWHHLAVMYGGLGEYTRKGRVADDITDAEGDYLSQVYDQWVAAALKSVEMDHGNGFYWTELSEAATFDGQDELATQAMGKALQLIPDEKIAYGWAFQMYQSKWLDNPQQFNVELHLLFQHPKALAQYCVELVRISFGMTDEDTVAFNEMGAKNTTALEMHIISTLEPYVQAHPQDIVALVNLGQVCLYAGQNDKAKTAYEMLVKLFPDDPFGYRCLRATAEAGKDWPAALQAVISIAKTNTKDTFSNMADDARDATRVYFMNQKYKESIASNLWLRNYHQSNVYTEMFAERSHLMLNDFVTAKVDLQYAANAEAEDFKANRNNYPQDVTSAEDALPSSFYSLSGLVDWKADNNIAEAQPLFDKALQKKDISADTYADDAVFLAGQGQKAAAQQSADKAKKMGYEDTTGMLKNAGL